MDFYSSVDHGTTSWTLIYHLDQQKQKVNGIC